MHEEQEGEDFPLEHWAEVNKEADALIAMTGISKEAAVVSCMLSRIYDVLQQLPFALPTDADEDGESWKFGDSEDGV